MKKLILFGTALLFLTNSGKAQNSISGYIVSLEAAKPIANATIFLNDKYGLPLDDSLRVTSDSTGFYKIAEVKPGTYIINAWTTYRAMDQQYAMLMQSNRIEIDVNLSVDFVFSENAFKYRLHSEHHPREAFVKPKPSPDLVARKAVRPQLYINSLRDTVGAWYIEHINNIKK